MDRNYSAHYLLLMFLLVYVDFTYGEVHYITPSQDIPCPQNSSCLTLSEFAAISSYNETEFAAISSYNETDLVSLLLLPGNHTLDRELSLTQVSDFSITKYGLDNEMVFVECSTPWGRFHISETDTTSIDGIHFIGCGNNKVSQVKWLTITGSIFQSVRDKSTVLEISEVSAATIFRSSFLSNSLQYQLYTKSFYPDNFLDYIYFERSTASGALYSAFSNISIISSKFMHNRADIGGAMVAHNSSLYLSKNTYSNNTANYGGAMVTSGSTIYVDSNTFIYNAASHYGGVMVTYNDTFTIHSTTFTNNSANVYVVSMGYTSVGRGGVMIIFSNSSIHIDNSTFSKNIVDGSGGIIHTEFDSSSVYINKSTFINNNAVRGGVMVIHDNSSIDIDNSTFSQNSASSTGGVIHIEFGSSSVYINKSTFANNNAVRGGVMLIHDNSSIDIDNSTFSRNSASSTGGVIHTEFGSSSVYINKSTFINNNAVQGGVMLIHANSSIDIDNSTFSQNSASLTGGVIYTTVGSSFVYINKSIFTNNSAYIGGVMSIITSSSIHIDNSTFSRNRANSRGGVIDIMSHIVYSFLYINKSIFANNSAEDGGVISISAYSSFTVKNSMFVNNKATSYGGVINCIDGTVNVISSNFSLNAVSDQGRGMIFILNCFTDVTNSTFNQNNGSLYSFNSNLTFSGYLKFENSTNTLRAGNRVASQEGGAITSFQSTVTFTRESIAYFFNNRARNGGAILATESTITMFGETTIANNMATMANGSGGGISLKQSRLDIREECQIVNNVATRGGGIHASSSTIVVHPSGTLRITSNTAKLGGGIYLKVNPKLYILKNGPDLTGDIINDDARNYLIIDGNHANYGGALYVADDTNSGACLSDNECFIQKLALYISSNYSLFTLNSEYTVSIRFSKNTAIVQGSDLFGGLLDRCIPSPFAEYSKPNYLYSSGVAYLETISNIALDSTHSHPVRICFCNSNHEPDCSYQPPVIRVQKGKAFNVSLVAVDHVNHTVDANVTVSLCSCDGGLGEGQQIKIVERNNSCTNLTFNVFSPHDFETLNLYPDGPCGSATLSTSNVTIQFINCTCPVGFEPLSNSQSPTRCECVCDSNLSSYITDCNIAINSVFRKGTNSWIKYIDNTDPTGYIIYSNCPFDYCQPQSQNVTINFNHLNGADSQCAYDRTGVLCGACKENLSLSLASSRCVPCHTHWPAVFVIILLAAAIAGILLVTAILALNITVSVGLVNGFIFYANIVSAESTIFFQSSEPSFPSVFVAWLNLDIGIDVCFIDGLDAYTKTWIQLAFPVYIISLVVVVIIVSEYSPRFAGLIGKKDPISTLATLILMSYAKLLSITITALSSAVLHYPDGKQETVWLPDGNVKYFHGKHIPLVLMALLIIIIGLPYTILLFLWQWIVRAPRWKVFNWTRNTKLNSFITTYHVPHNSMHRYWTGLLLLVRVVLYITASVTVSASPKTYPLITIIFVGALIFLSKIFNSRVYKNKLIDVVDTVLYFNLIGFAVFNLYDVQANLEKQTAVAYISTIITFVLFIGAICYHVILLIKKETKHRDDLNEYPLAQLQPANAQVTFSVVDPPKRDENQSPTDRKDGDERDITGDRQIDTPQHKN